MVGGGINEIGVFDILEIIDLETTKSNCANFPPLPLRGIGASGFFVDDDHPIVCGGWNTETKFVKCVIFISFFGYISSLCLPNLILSITNKAFAPFSSRLPS
jgi:hypothetical protein